MLRVLLVLVLVGVTVYALVDCVRTEEAQVRVFPKTLWLLVIVLVVLFGPLAWLLGGRDRGTGRAAPLEPPRPVAPDDDPNFLRDLDIELWQREERDGDGDGDGDDPQRV